MSLSSAVILGKAIWVIVMIRASRIAVLASLLALSACVAPANGPTIAVMPGQGKSFEAFQQDDLVCRQFANQSIGFASPGQAAAQSAVGSAALGTAVGAATGALIGAAAGNPGAGAAIGAGSGLLVGAAGGAGAAQFSGASLQQQFDIGYAQCMAAKGNYVPPLGSLVAQGSVAPPIALAGWWGPTGGWWGPGWGWWGPGWGAWGWRWQAGWGWRGGWGGRRW
jgi:hypothetical protein